MLEDVERSLLDEASKIKEGELSEAMKRRAARLMTNVEGLNEAGFDFDILTVDDESDEYQDAIVKAALDKLWDGTKEVGTWFIPGATVLKCGRLLLLTAKIGKTSSQALLKSAKIAQKIVSGQGGKLSRKVVDKYKKMMKTSAPQSIKPRNDHRSHEPVRHHRSTRYSFQSYCRTCLPSMPFAHICQCLFVINCLIFSELPFPIALAS